MDQPLHNNAIPPHPAIAAQQQLATATPAPEATPVSPPSEESTSVQSLFDAFDGPKEADPSPPPPPVQVQPPAPPEPPQEIPVSVEDLLAGGASAPVTEAPAPQAPAAPQPQVPQAPTVDMGALQKQAIDFLMANEYKLGDEERTQLISAPDEVLPRLAARMHVGIATQLAQQVAQAIPALIQQHMEGHLKAQRAESDFFGRYPKLNRPEWKPAIAESLQMVKQMNPNASREQIITEGAALAAFRIQSKYGNQHTPQPPQLPNSGQRPYVPVAPGGGVSPPTNAQPANPWAELAADPNWNPW